jgi:hypothetical protein
MSELLQVAASLRKLTDDQLETLLTERMINASGAVDFFDIAEALTKPNSISAAISGLPFSQARALENLVAGSTEQTEAATELTKLMLVDSEFKPFESTREAFKQFPAIRENLTSVTEQTSTDQVTVDRDAGLEIFETVQAINELIFDLELRYVREVGKRNVGLPDLKRLANHLRKNNDYAREIYDLSGFANLITLADGRWQLTPQSDAWLTWSPAERYLHLCLVWRQMLGDTSARELNATISNLTLPISLSEKLPAVYPFADNSVSSKITKLSKFAAMLGLSANGWMSSWCSKVLVCEHQAASELATQHLPANQNRIIVQADLSIIAPGPLPTGLEIQLRRFVNTEQIGVASTYRLSALSLSHGLETGMDENQIRELLAEMSGTKLPQPVDYLIREAANRFKKLTVSAGIDSARSVIRSSDVVQLASIMNDSRLKPFAIHALPNGDLVSRFEPEVVYFGLREIGLPAVRIDASGEVISPHQVNAQADGVSATKSVREDIARLREQDAKVGDSPDGDDLTRQIELAIKNKGKVLVTVKSAAGDEIDFALEPIGIANGRLRAKDRKADIERTLPVANIIRVVIQ